MTRDDRDAPALPALPSLAVRKPVTSGAGTPTAQGPAPADLAQRETPATLPPAADGLSAAEVTRLVGGDAGTTGTNHALGAAEGLEPESGS